MNRLRLLPLIVAGLSGAASAAWTGNPTQPVEKGAFIVGYQVSSRDVENTQASAGSQTLELKERGLVVETRSAINPVFQLAFRVIPFTGRVNLEGDPFNPHVAGAGLGLYVAPPEALGPVHLGAAAIWDGAGGARKRVNPTASKQYDRLYWSEATLSAAASVAPVEFLSVYAGVSYVSLRAQFNQNGVKATFKEHQPWGAFGGVSVLSNEAWFLNVEGRAGGERAMSASLGYKY
jgi:hypothetical protein